MGHYLKSRVHPQYRDDLLLGDTPDRFARRLATLNQIERRRAKVIQLATDLHHQVSHLSRLDLLANGSAHRSPRMNLRKLHDNIVYEARHHCHAALYRSRAAHDLCTSGGLRYEGRAVIHCEHTVPTGPVLAQLHWMFAAGALDTPRDLLTAIFDFGIVTAMSQDADRQRLNCRRTIDGIFGAWTDVHPEFFGGAAPALFPEAAQLAAMRPFRRYAETGIEILFAATGRPLDIQAYTIADHRALLKTLPAYDPLAYFP